jgi:hypothetical protein
LAGAAAQSAGFEPVGAVVVQAGAVVAAVTGASSHGVLGRHGGGGEISNVDGRLHPPGGGQLGGRQGPAMVGGSITRIKKVLDADVE